MTAINLNIRINSLRSNTIIKPFMTSLYCIETSPMICRANQWAVFFMIGTSIMKELIKKIFEGLILKYSQVRKPLFPLPKAII